MDGPTTSLLPILKASIKVTFEKKKKKTTLKYNMKFTFQGRISQKVSLLYAIKIYGQLGYSCTHSWPRR